MPENAVNPKNSLRSGLMSRRLALTPECVQKASAAACARVFELAAYQRARSVLLYLPLKNEIDTSLILGDLWKRGVSALLPRCLPGPEREIELACPSCLAELKPGRYGILEPDPNSCPGLEDPAPDLAVIPGVGFDRKGARLGFGAGYYDRLLASPGFAQTLRLGLSYAFCLLDELPSDPWDQAMHLIVTEGETLWIKK